MLTCREFSAWIVSEGKPLSEYLVSVDKNTNKVSCWIPGQVGNDFSIHWRDEGTCKNSCSEISLDGFSVPGRFLFGFGVAFREGVRTGTNTERPFVFLGQPDTTEVYPFGTQSNADAGTIVLMIRLVTINGLKPANELRQLPAPSRSQSDNLCIGYGEERPTCQRLPQTWNVNHDESGNQPYVTFVFRYGSPEFLLSQGIMPVDDALQIPLAIRQACTMNYRVASTPFVRGNAMLVMPRPIPNPLVRHNVGRMNPALQNAFNPGSIPVRSVNNVRTVSTGAARRVRQMPSASVRVMSRADQEIDELVYDSISLDL